MYRKENHDKMELEINKKDKSCKTGLRFLCGVLMAKSSVLVVSSFMDLQQGAQYKKNVLGMIKTIQVRG